MTARNELAVEDSLGAITDALLTASRLLVAISAAALLVETIWIGRSQPFAPNEIDPSNAPGSTAMQKTRINHNARISTS